MRCVGFKSYKKLLDRLIHQLLSPIVPFVDRLSILPKVLPRSLLTLITGMSSVSLVSHHVTTTLAASAPISTLVESEAVVLLRCIT